MPRKRGRARLDSGIEVDLDNLAADELEDLMNGDARGREQRSRVITLPRVAWLDRVVSPASARERYGRP